MPRSHKPCIKLHCINLETNLEFEQFRSLIFCNTRGQQHFKFFNCLFIEHFCIGEQKKIYLYKINVYRKINEDLLGRKDSGAKIQRTDGAMIILIPECRLI